MRGRGRFRVWAMFCLLGAAGACGGGKGSSPDGGGLGGIGGSTGGEGGAGGLVGCLDMPGQLDRPPSGRLPCELIPPGLRLQ